MITQKKAERGERKAERERLSFICHVCRFESLPLTLKKKKKEKRERAEEIKWLQTEVCTINEEWDVELGGKPGKRFKERMRVTLLEWQKR